jgi:hypothetical protein
VQSEQSNHLQVLTVEIHFPTGVCIVEGHQRVILDYDRRIETVRANEEITCEREETNSASTSLREFPNIPRNLILANTVHARSTRHPPLAAALDSD